MGSSSIGAVEVIDDEKDRNDEKKAEEKDEQKAEKKDEQKDESGWTEMETLQSSKLEIRVTASRPTFTRGSSSHSLRPKKLEEAAGRALRFPTPSSSTNIKGSSTLRLNKVLAPHFSYACQFKVQT